MWDDVFGKRWAISNSEKGSSGVGYVGIVVVQWGRGRKGIFVLFPHTIAYAHEGSNGDEAGISMYRSWVEFDDHWRHSKA